MQAESTKRAKCASYSRIVFIRSDMAHQKTVSPAAAAPAPVTSPALDASVLEKGITEQQIRSVLEDIILVSYTFCWIR
jgi:hypothetical protein